MTTVTPTQQQNKSTTGRDFAISTGVGLLGGATGVAAGYNMKPTANQYAKAVIKQQLEDIDTYKSVLNESIEKLKSATPKERKMISKMFDSMQAAFKEAGITVEDAANPQAPKSFATKFKNFFRNFAIGSKVKEAPEEFAGRLKTLLEDRIKTVNSKEFKENIIETFKSFDNETKNALKPLFRGSNMVKWGAIGAGVASLLTAYLLCFAKDRNDNNQSEVTEQV